MKKSLCAILLFPLFLVSCENVVSNNSNTNNDATHTITYLNTDGSILSSLKVADGKDAYYDGATPTKESDDNYHYIFNHWDKNLNDVSKNIKTSPVFRKVKKNDTIINELNIDEVNDIVTLKSELSESKDYIIPSTYNNKFINSFSHVISNNEIEYNIYIPNSFNNIRLLTKSDNIKVNIYFEGTMDDWVSIDKEIYYFTRAGGKIYINNELLTELIISEGITEIKNGTFSNKQITSYSIPNSIRNIYADPYLVAGFNQNALYEENGVYYLGNENNKHLIYVGGSNEIEENIVKFKDETTMIFRLECGADDTIYLHENIRSIGLAPVFQVTNTVYFEGDYYDYFNMNLGTTCFHENFYINNIKVSELETFEIPSNITVLNPNVFYPFKNLKTLIVPENIKHIEERSLVLPNLEYLDLGFGVKTIDSQAIYTNAKIIIRNNVEVIEAGAFMQCHGHIYIEFNTIPQGWDKNWRFLSQGIDPEIVNRLTHWGGTWEFNEDNLPSIKE